MNQIAQLSAASVVALAGCASVQETSLTAGATSDSLVSLESGLDGLAGRFNADSEKARIVALLSPS
ncbi:MAG: hypothetical protein ACYTGP_12935 [Planctomycetota bacterium]|jgi:hypothetical protein